MTNEKNNEKDLDKNTEISSGDETEVLLNETPETEVKQSFNAPSTINQTHDIAALCDNSLSAVADEIELSRKPAKLRSKDVLKLPKTADEIKKFAFSYIILLAVSVIRAFNLYIFVFPHNFAPGGVTGISTILQYLTKFSSGIFLLCINIPLIAVSFFFVSKVYAVRSGFCTLITSGLLSLFTFLESKGIKLYQYEAVSDLTPLLSAVVAGIIGGFCVAMNARNESSQGGTDVIAALIHKKYNSKNISWFIWILDSIVIFASFFVYGYRLEPVILALAMTFASAKTADIFIEGFKNALKFEIITSNPERIKQRIKNEVGRGLTSIKAEGMFSERYLIICIVRKRQAPLVKKIIKEEDDTFAYISTTSDVIGLGFSPKNDKNSLI